MSRLVFFILSFSLLVIQSTSICREHRLAKALDCSGLALKDINRITTADGKWVLSLSLRRNLLVSVNITKVLLLFPNIRLVDLRENPLDCRLVRQHTIIIKSDCIPQPKLSSSSLEISHSSAVPPTTSPQTSSTTHIIDSTSTTYWYSPTPSHSSTYRLPSAVPPTTSPQTSSTTHIIGSTSTTNWYSPTPSHTSTYRLPSAVPPTSPQPSTTHIIGSTSTTYWFSPTPPHLSPTHSSTYRLSSTVPPTSPQPSTTHIIDSTSTPYWFSSMPSHLSPTHSSTYRISSTVPSTSPQPSTPSRITNSINQTVPTPKDSKHSFLLLFIIVPLIVFILILICIYISCRYYSQRVVWRRQRIAMHELASPQTEPLPLDPLATTEL